jgi:hypothetical protein
MNDEAQFEVTDHFEIPNRGAFLIGHIRTGMFRIGMVVCAEPSGEVFTISGIEFVDNTREKKYWNALVFQEKPELDTLRRCFPVGTVLKASDQKSQQVLAG